MISGIKPKVLLFRDGTSQSQRYNNVLNPDYVKIDERTIADFIRFAQDYAKKVRFFDKNNNSKGNWEAFLIDSIENLSDSRSAEKQQWVNDLISYINNPDDFANDSEKSRMYSKPHLVLFISFLQVMGIVKDQLNEFTKRHLDFYYYEVLGLSRKEAVPDIVNVLVELTNGVNEFLLKENTLLLAGKDASGKDLIYKTQGDTLINQSKVELLKTLFVDKKITGIQEAQQENKTELDFGVLSMMQIAVGDPLPGDYLPEFPDGAKSLQELNAAKNGTDKVKKANAEAYITGQLFLSLENFDFIMSLKRDSFSETWNQAYEILEKAFHEKEKWNRKQILKQKHQEDSKDGFNKMFQYALGDPNPGDELPLYDGTKADLALIYKDITSTSSVKINLATNYASQELRQSVSDFKTCMKTLADSKTNIATPQDWEKVYTILEKSQRQKRNIVFTAPLMEDIINICQVEDARASAFTLEGEEGKGTKRFNTFGNGTSKEERTFIKSAAVGFAVSSPQLELKEGKRKITLTLSFKNNLNIKFDKIKKTFPSETNNYNQPFQFLFSGEKKWNDVIPTSYKTSYFIKSDSKDVFTATVNAEKNCLTKPDKFVASDVNKLFIFADGSIYLVKNLLTETTAKVRLLGMASNPSGNKKYGIQQVSINIEIQLNLSEMDEAVCNPTFIHQNINVQTQFPILGIILNNESQKQVDASTKFNHYQYFKDLEIEKISVKIDVENIKALELQNDNSLINFKKPFEPFGYSPQIGNSLYISHPELAAKKLDRLDFNFEWMKVPTDLKSYYNNYTSIINQDEDFKRNFPIISGNDIFKCGLKIVENGNPISLTTIDLFDKTNAQLKKSNSIDLKTITGAKDFGYNYDTLSLDSTEQEVINWKRYFKLELNNPDFHHDSYPILLNKQAVLTDAVLSKLVLNPPYLPKLKSITAGYSASFELGFTPEFSRLNRQNTAYHVHPFGYKQLDTNVQASNEELKSLFLPKYSNEGELYIGLSNLNLPQNISILFQFAEGSADPDVEKPVVVWSYLAQNDWKTIPESHIISDSTDNFVKTGIIEFELPEDLSKLNELMVDELYWIRASVQSNAAAIPDLVNIFSQVVSAQFVNHDNDQSHFTSFLPAESIKETLDKVPEINKIIQPYTSSKGKAAESAQGFYNRVSERIRHKNRALTMWDYERIILERFPEIYKVKCIPSEFEGNVESYGQVEAIVIPDIIGKLPFNPFQPKVPSETIHNIEKHLKKRMPAFAQIRVKNPSFLQVKTRFAVKFKQGFNPGYYTKKLEDELKKYLAPWAYNEGSDITIGGKIYANMIVNFIAEKHYVDYVAGIKLFQSKDGIDFTDVRILNGGANVVQADKPDVVLVSAITHEIDMIRESGYQDKVFEGIDYMKIELDFIVD